MKHILFAGLSLAILLVSGCQVVHVTDQQGKPIDMADVSVTTQEGGATGLSVKTMFGGYATLPMSQAAPGTREWLEIRKDGYAPKRILRPEDGSVEVPMLRAPGAKTK
jgi:hypothetical protein